MFVQMSSVLGYNPEDVKIPLMHPVMNLLGFTVCSMTQQC